MATVLFDHNTCNSLAYTQLYARIAVVYVDMPSCYSFALMGHLVVIHNSRPARYGCVHTRKLLFIPCYRRCTERAKPTPQTDPGRFWRL